MRRFSSSPARRPGNTHRRQRGLIAAVALGLLVSGALGPVWAPMAWAVEPDEMLPDPAMEHRARDISAELRCVVCQNESIDESNAEMARDMRLLVRERLKAGDTNEEVEQYLVDRYGDFVLLNPPFKPTTWLLWFGPALILAGGAAAAWAFYRRRSTEALPSVMPLSAEEQARLKALIADAPGEGDGGDKDTGDRRGPGGPA